MTSSNESQFHLFRTRRFLPLLITVVLGAANDNIFKNALVIFVLYFAAGRAPVGESILVTLAAGLFILPFFLFSATAGQLADKFEKARMIRWIKLAEIVIMGLGAVALAVGSTAFLLAVLFLMGAQSTFFGPLKYSILPAALREDELISGNAFVETGTFVAILGGTIAGGLLIGFDGGATVVGAVVVAVAVFGWLASLKIPRAEPPQPDLAVSLNLFTVGHRIVRDVAKTRTVLLSILGISWFWLVGATLLAQFPNLAKSVFNADNHVVTFFLSTITVGIGIGSMLCNVLLKGEISARHVPTAALLMSAFLVDLWAASPRIPPEATIGLTDFLGTAAHWRVVLDLLGVAVCGGIFTVPLYAIMQSRSDAAERSQTVAGNNILNALFMVVGALAASAMLALDYSVPEIFLALAVGNLVVAIWLRRSLGAAARGRPRLEILAATLVLALVALAFLEPIPQDPRYHAFADARPWLGIPNFGNTASNLGFAAVGLWGLWTVLGGKGRANFADRKDIIPYVVFFAAVALIGVGSTWYHLAPDSDRLFWDRLPMTVAFTSLVACFLADRVNRDHVIRWGLPLLVAAGVASLLYWRSTEAQGHGDLRYYGLIQFYPLVALPLIVMLFPNGRHTSGRALFWLIFWYAVAKVVETFDTQIYGLLGHAVSGHTLKHLAAAGAVAVVIRMLRRHRAEDA